MSMDDWLNAGKNIMNDIQDAVTNQDYRNLDQKINHRVDEAMGQSGTNRTDPGYSKADLRHRGSWFMTRKVSRMTGMIRMIVGGAGTLYNAIMVLASIALLVTGVEGIVAMVVFFFLAVGFGFMFRSGRESRKLVDAYYDYGRRLGSVEFFEIAPFARTVGIPESQMRSNLQKMLEKGYLPQARYDDSRTTLILTDHAYQQYLQLKRGQKNGGGGSFSGNASGRSGGGTWKAAEEARAQQAAQNRQKDEKTWTDVKQEQAAEQARAQQAAAEARKKQQEAAEEEKLDPEVRSAIEKGRQYLKHIRKVNDEIPDTEEMSNKLYKLEDITNRIFERMKKHPESAKSMKKFMDYYLPTTQKLMDAYVELYHQPEAGENIKETKKQIESSFDMVNQAYEKMLDSMFEDTAWDVSSDINVMKTMMQQDGLSDEGQIRKSAGKEEQKQDQT